MNRIKASFYFTVCFAMLVSACSPASVPQTDDTTLLEQSNFLSQAPSQAPWVFMPDLIASSDVELSLVVHPDLQEIYFTRLDSGRAVIMVSHCGPEGWSEAEPASFSGQHNDIAPFISTDGALLIFSSDRPLAASAAPQEDYLLWTVEREGEGWSEPTRLQLPVDSMGGEAHASMTLDGTLYYVANYPELGGEGLYRSCRVEGVYQTPQRIDFFQVTDQIVDAEPFVSPREDFLLFYSAGRTDNLSTNERVGDLYISYRNDQGEWGEPQNLGDSINSVHEESTPTISPDGSVLFFASNRETGKFPDIYWISYSPVKDGVSLEERNGLSLSYADLINGFNFNGPVDELALTPPLDAQPPLQRFEGRLELLSEQEEGRMENVRGELEPVFGYLPEFDYEFVQTDDGYLVPVRRGLIIANHPYWNLHLEPGRVWQEPGDQGYSRASLPFTLSIKGSNSAYNGTLTFLFDDQSVSKVWYQVTQEVSTYYRINLWGLLDAVYHPQKVDGADEVRDAFARELEKRYPTKPIEDLAVDYPGVDLSAFGSGVTPEHMSWYGVIIGGMNYVGGCRTRFGIYPYCESMRAASFSTAKSAFASVALMRLAQKYGSEVPDLLIKDYVPESAVAAGDWENVTFENALDMATGNYFSSGFIEDDNSQKMGEFFNAQPFDQRIAAAFTAPSRAEPGTRWVYRTSDTFILMTAMQRFLQGREGEQADIFDLVVKDVYLPLGVGPGFLSSMRTADRSWQGQAEGGYGLWWTPDDVAKIITFLNRGDGMIDGEQVLHPGMLASSLQRDAEDRGVRIDTRQMYNNAFWATRYSTANGFGCEFWTAQMQGVSGNVITLFPNGTVYYYFSDNQEFSWMQALREVNELLPICTNP